MMAPDAHQGHPRQRPTTHRCLQPAFLPPPPPLRVPRPPCPSPLPLSRPAPMAPVVTVSAGRAHPPAWIPAAGVLPLMTPHRPMDGGRCRVRGALSGMMPEKH